MKTIRAAVCCTCQKVSQAMLTVHNEWVMTDHPPVYIKIEDWVPYHDGYCAGSGTTPQWIDFDDEKD